VPGCRWNKQKQGLSQLLTSVLTVVGVLAMMLWISPVLAAVSIVTIPLAIGVTFVIARRSQTQFAAQWDRTGALNGLVEETHTGHALVLAFGQREPTIAEFGRQNKRLQAASFRAQFLSGVIQPAVQFLGNLNYVVIAALGGYQVANGIIPLGDVQAFIQYSRQFTMPITQIASQMNMLQSGLASAERVFEFLDAPEEAIALAEQGSAAGADRGALVAGMAGAVPEGAVPVAGRQRQGRGPPGRRRRGSFRRVPQLAPRPVLRPGAAGGSHGPQGPRPATRAALRRCGNQRLDGPRSQRRGRRANRGGGAGRRPHSRRRRTGSCCRQLPPTFRAVSSTRMIVAAANMPCPMTTGSGKCRSGGTAILGLTSPAAAPA